MARLAPCGRILRALAALMVKSSTRFLCVTVQGDKRLGCAQDIWRFKDPTLHDANMRQMVVDLEI